MHVHSYYTYIPADGAELFTAVCLPEPTGKFPVLVCRSPYVDGSPDKTEDWYCQFHTTENWDWIQNGYALVYQHCRGQGRSTGEFIPFIYEREDGLALQEWIRQQPFYNGELYLSGGSYTSSVHYATAPYAPDVKGVVMAIMDSERYNLAYRNGFFKISLGGWYVDVYKKKTLPQKYRDGAVFEMLPLADFTKTVFNEPDPELDAIFRHPDREDPFWREDRYGGAESYGGMRHIRTPILFIGGFYDIFLSGMFDQWKDMDEEARSMCSFVVSPYHHGNCANGQPVKFPDGEYLGHFGNLYTKWFESIRNGTEPPVPLGKVSYYKLFGGEWCCDDFADPETQMTFPLGKGEKTYRYNPYTAPSFKGGLTQAFDGNTNAYQNPPGQRSDILTFYTPVFEEDVFVKGKMKASLRVRSTCEDTCFYIRVSLARAEGDYGLRDDINQISRFCPDYVPGEEVTLDFSFDEHAFVIHRGERLRIDVASAARNIFVRHTNRRGLFSQQTDAAVADNTVICDRSFLTICYE